MSYVVFRRRRYFVKAILSILLGMMLLTSLVGITYANPVQPLDNNNPCTQPPNNPNYDPGNCGAHAGGNPNPPEHGCTPMGGKGPDGSCCGDSIHADTTCCFDGITPHSAQISDIHTDTDCCGTGITPHSAETSDIQPDCPV